MNGVFSISSIVITVVKVVVTTIKRIIDRFRYDIFVCVNISRIQHFPKLATLLSALLVLHML